MGIRNDLSSDRTRNVSHHPTALKQLRISSPIVDLDLKSVDFISHIEFLRFVTSFTGLKHLRCDTIWFPSSSQEGTRSLDSESGRPKPQAHGIGKLRLTTLNAGNIPGDILRTLLDLTAPTLESLAVATKQDVDGF
ncbi:hypothetical protein V8D89_004987 [Ganoderma adspersum]